jgi:hypothetical protein
VSFLRALIGFEAEMLKEGIALGNITDNSNGANCRCRSLSRETEKVGSEAKSFTRPI